MPRRGEFGAKLLDLLLRTLYSNIKCGDALSLYVCVRLLVCNARQPGLQIHAYSKCGKRTFSPSTRVHAVKKHDTARLQRIVHGNCKDAFDNEVDSKELGM